jgi:hypothetical protein
MNSINMSCKKCGGPSDGRYSLTTGGKKDWCFECHQKNNTYGNAAYALFDAKMGDVLLYSAKGHPIRNSKKYPVDMLFDGLSIEEILERCKEVVRFSNPNSTFKITRRGPRLVRRPRTNNHTVVAKTSTVRQQVENLYYTGPLQDAIDAQCALTGTTPTQHDENGGDIIFLDFVIEVKREARDFKYALKVLRDAAALTRELNRTMRPVIALPSEPLDWERDLARNLGVLVWIYPQKLKLYN